MPLPNSGSPLSLQQIHFEIYGSNPTSATDLEALVNASNLSDKVRPHDIGMFYGYTHSTASPVVSVDLWSNTDYGSYLDVVYRVRFSTQTTRSLTLNLREIADSTGYAYNDTMAVPSGTNSTFAYRIYYKNSGSGYLTLFELQAGSNYVVSNTEPSSGVYVPPQNGGGGGDMGYV
jgi:hypothetical protein